MSDQKLSERIRDENSIKGMSVVEYAEEVAALERELEATREKLSRAPAGCDHGVAFEEECRQCEVNFGVATVAVEEAAAIPLLLGLLGAVGVRVERRPGPAGWAVTNVRADAAELELELAWGIIANASGGDWTRESKDWVGAAERWRDRWHAAQSKYPKAAT